MRIAIIGATGKQGNLIVQEAVKQGYDVTAVVRNKDKITDSRVKVLEKSIFDLEYEDIKDYEVIVDAFGTWSAETQELHQTSLKHLADILSGKSNRLLVVGGAASLYVDSQKTIRLIDTPEFPDAFKPVGSNMGKAFDALKIRNDVNWTYLSPAADFHFEGKRTGSYKLGQDNLILNAAGESYVSYADYAIALVDEIKNKAYLGKRFTVVSEKQ